MDNNETTENTNAFEQQQQHIKPSPHTGEPDTTNSADETAVDPCNIDQNDANPPTVRSVDSETADQHRLQDQPAAVDLSVGSNPESKTNDETTTSHTKGSALNTTNPGQFSNHHHQPSVGTGLFMNLKLSSDTNDEVGFHPSKINRKHNFNRFSKNHQPYAAVDLSSNSNKKPMINDNNVAPHYNRYTSTSNAVQSRDYYQYRQDPWLHLTMNSYKKKRLYFRKKAYFSSTNRRNFNNFNEFQRMTSKYHSKRTSNMLKGAGDLDKLNKMTAKDFDDDRYARFGIHEYEMKDYIRTMAYKNCIEHCSENHFKDKVVLVIRSGIGLLPLLCVRHGFAKKVIGLEQSACIEYARRIVEDNKYSNQITLIQSSVQDLKKLPDELTQVDVILSDFLGDCVLGQGDQMEQVIEARDRFLKPNGLMVPMSVSLYGHISEHRKAYENQRIRKSKNKVDQSVLSDYDSDSSTDSTRCSWWSNVYGFDMRSNQTYLVDKKSDNEETEEKWYIMPEPITSHFNSSRVMSSTGLIKTFDMYKCTIDETRYVQCTDLELECVIPYATNKGEYVHMLELFMIVDFPSARGSLDNSFKIRFSTSSFSPYTRYKQTGLLLRDQLLVENGDVFVINEFCMQRGPQQNPSKELLDETIDCQNTLKKFRYEDNLKLRLRYTFINKYIKAMNRRCAYTVIKYLF